MLPGRRRCLLGQSDQETHGGAIPTDTTFVQVDLSSYGAGQTFYTEIYLVNTTTGWSAQQYRFVAHTGGGCTSTSSWAWGCRG